MAVAMIDGSAVRVELESLGVSISAFARFVRMDRADVSRALSTGRAVAPDILYRLALGLDQLKRGGHRAE